jgi:XTP/dITP diphosphohydrolase
MSKLPRLPGTEDNELKSKRQWQTGTDKQSEKKLQKNYLRLYVNTKNFARGCVYYVVEIQKRSPPMQKKQILFATKNKGKAYELSQILDSANVQLLLLSDFPEIPDIPETGSTFEENARIKAHAVFAHFGLPVFADDSGLSVDALHGAPGIFSSRFAGECATDQENIDKLMDSLRSVLPPYPARFICAALYFDGNIEVSTLGEMRGHIINEKRGKNGFGYDPIFVPEGYDKTTAELSDQQKNMISHRGIAFRGLCSLLRERALLP